MHRFLADPRKFLVQYASKPCSISCMPVIYRNRASIIWTTSTLPITDVPVLTDSCFGSVGSLLHAFLAPVGWNGGSRSQPLDASSQPFSRREVPDTFGVPTLQTARAARILQKEKVNAATGYHGDSRDFLGLETRAKDLLQATLQASYRCCLILADQFRRPEVPQASSACFRTQARLAAETLFVCYTSLFGRP